ncbi:thermonuclease family protein [Patulibacter minatonensis]|uniref:thermonuclease family protein n=1 Tax=Patulibacter minatonensis TaxID=298163 RepID=UPI0004B6F1D9|nr:thermonuclease family protein [Patulibacter minatonensis]
MRPLRGSTSGTLLRVLLGLATVCGVVAAVVLSTGDRRDRDRSFRSITGDDHVVRAVDGDTLIVRAEGRAERVGVLGIAAPADVGAGTSAQPCGHEAAANATRWAADHRLVHLIRDPPAPDRDGAGRLLRYVQPSDGSRDLAFVQVEAGLARVDARGQDLTLLPALEHAERHARAARLGLWGAGCPG